MNAALSLKSQAARAHVHSTYVQCTYDTKPVVQSFDGPVMLVLQCRHAAVSDEETMDGGDKKWKESRPAAHVGVSPVDKGVRDVLTHGWSVATASLPSTDKHWQTAGSQPSSVFVLVRDAHVNC
jgi:hypothetical protein